MGHAKAPKLNDQLFTSKGPNTPKPHRVVKVKDDAGNALACNHCRLKKIKCQSTPDGCQKCSKLGITCVWPREDQRKQPSSKSHVRDLHKRIEQLERALELARSQRGQYSSPNSDHKPTIQATRRESAISIDQPLSQQQSPNNIIARICRRQSQLNSDAEGQYKFFGPTSSLHLTESVSSSILGSWGDGSMHENRWTVEDVDPEAQAHLLQMYWDYQHTVLQVFDKDAFLGGMTTKQTKYFSKALLYCVFACAARISPRPRVRALALPADDDLDDEQPYLIATASKYLEEELKRPGLTTIQSLLLLSVIHCALGRDTKGWLLTGDACRLAIDLGLHKNATQLAPGNLSPDDIHARQITFWGCIVFDRLWAMYLGRPYCLKTEGLSHRQVEPPIHSMNTWESKMAYAWATLLEIVGYICDALNADDCREERFIQLNDDLQDWHNQLDVMLQYNQQCQASVAVLHMQYCATVILLHRPTANFGSGFQEPNTQSGLSRRLCVHHATEIARFLQDYRTNHGDASTLSGVSLHTIATAATTLVADVAERGSTDISFKMQCLKTCVRTLGELERTYLVAKRVRKIIQLIIRLCHLESEVLSNNHHNMSGFPSDQGADQLETGEGRPENTEGGAEYRAIADEGDVLPEMSISGYSPFAFDEFMPMYAQFDIFHTFDT